MIPKSGYRFSEKIMLNNNLERDDDSKKSHLALALSVGAHAVVFGRDPHAGCENASFWNADARKRATLDVCTSSVANRG